MNNLREMFEEFNSYQTQEKWLPFLIIFCLIFIVMLFMYNHFLKSKLMNKIYKVHGFIEKNEFDTSKNVHFHNTDLIDGNFKLDNRLFKDGFDWVGKHYLFIPNGKINTVRKRFNKLTVWYNGYLSKGFMYRVKKLPKDWKEKRLSKSQITKYSGTFIIQNLLVKTINLSSLKIDSRSKKDFILTYLFDNGSERIIKISAPEFFDEIANTTIPYNISFLDQCEVIELW